MRAREAPIVVGGEYELPSRNLVVIESDLGGGALACRYIEHDVTPVFARGLVPAGEPVWLTERFIAKHGRGPRR